MFSPKNLPNFSD